MSDKLLNNEGELWDFFIMKEVVSKRWHNLTFSDRAASETRTRDPQLGKLMLYQLSYCRILYIYLSGCKGNKIFLKETSIFLNISCF